MRNPFYCGVGGVVSADIAVPHHERELAFYAQLLTTGSDPLWRDDLMNNHGMPIIGLGKRSAEYESLPLQWMPHFQVSDVAASVQRTLALGGQVLMHGKDEDGGSLWAGLVDPTGVAFGVIPVVADASAAMMQSDRMGRIAGLSLAVADVSSSCTFYEQVVGWSRFPGGSADGCDMARADGMAAAQISLRGGQAEGVPSVWLISLPVGDLEESLRRAREGGGEVLGKVAGSEHVVVRDPVGVYLALQANG